MKLVGAKCRATISTIERLQVETIISYDEEYDCFITTDGWVVIDAVPL